MSMIQRPLGVLACAAFAALLGGCVTEVETSTRPELETDFDVLYRVNCGGCHGVDGRRGAAQALNDALYLAVVSDATLQQVITHGVPGTPMLPFGQEAGGTLTRDQIRALVDQMRSRWGHPERFVGVSLPAYSVQDAIARGEAAGNPDRGSAAQKIYCAECHGDNGRGGSGAGSIVDEAFLALTSDQALRTAVIAGHADGDVPAGRGVVPVAGGDRRNGRRPISAQEISDVVAWLASQRGHHD
jgi:mono/diheme cytochrome c family protein